MRPRRAQVVVVASGLAAAAAVAACASRRVAPAPARPATAPRSASATPATAATATTTGTAAAPATPGASPPPAPAYSLADDVARRVAEASTELGAGATAAVVSDTFVLVAPRGNAKGFASSVDLTKRTLAAYFTGRFHEHPREALSVYLFFDRDSYASYCRRAFHEPCMSPFGFWRPDERRIVMNAAPGLGTLTHELVHPIVDADFPDAPTWINEGIASLFEAPVLGARGDIHGAKNWRLPRLTRALSSKREAPRARLATLFGMPDDTFRDDDEDLHYAMARYTCQWLDGRGKLWPFYQAWRDGFARDPTGAKAFESVTGETHEGASAAWERWVRGLGDQ